MTQNTINRLPTDLLFQKLNEKRLAEQQPALENALLASKLGILIAVKTDNYVNFRHNIVELSSKQVSALSSILDEYFNVKMDKDIKELLIQSSSSQTGTQVDALAEVMKAAQERTQTTGLFSKLKRFFARKRAE